MPVAERKDGVASFFKKQVVKEEKKPDVDGSSMALKGESKPVKASGDRKVHSPPTTSVKTEPASHDQKPNKRPSEKVKVLDDGIGDDSNAPNKKRKVEATMSKAKKEEDASDDDDDEVEVIPDPGPPKRQTRSSKAGPPSKAHRPATGQSGGSPQSVRRKAQGLCRYAVRLIVADFVSGPSFSRFVSKVNLTARSEFQDEDGKCCCRIFLESIDLIDLLHAMTDSFDSKSSSGIGLVWLSFLHIITQDLLDVFFAIYRSGCTILGRFKLAN